MCYNLLNHELKRTYKMTTKKDYGITLTIRMPHDDYAKIKRACYRDEMKPSTFARIEIMKAVEKLIKSQELNGYQCMKPL